MREVKEDVDEMIDPRIKWSTDLPHQLLKQAELCCHLRRKDRPAMEKILEKLDDLCKSYQDEG